MYKIVDFGTYIVLRFCAIVSLVLHLPHKFLRKRYRKATGFASSGKKETQRQAIPTSEHGIMIRIWWRGS